jgi:hypothetical protein
MDIALQKSEVEQDGSAMRLMHYDYEDSPHLRPLVIAAPLAAGTATSKSCMPWLH